MNRTFRIVALCAVVMSYTTGSAVVAQQTTHVLPKQFGKWVLGDGPADEAKLVFPNNHVLQEAGVKNVELERYSDGKKWLRIWLEEYRDPSSAFEAYTSSLDPKLNASTVGPLTAAGDDKLVALVGNRMVRILWIRNATDADLKLLLDSVKEKADRTPLPPVRSYLPEAGLIQGTQRYALGPAGGASGRTSLNRNKLLSLTPGIVYSIVPETLVC